MLEQRLVKYKRILVCGSRWWGRLPDEMPDDPEEAKKVRQIALDQQNNFDKVMFELIHDKMVDIQNLTIISGGAKGADTLAIEWASECDFPCEIYVADWNKHGKAAGPIRNQQMIDEGKPDLVVAFMTEGSRGTRDMVGRARKAGIPTFITSWEL